MRELVLRLEPGADLRRAVETLTGSVSIDGAHLHARISSARGEVFGVHLAYGNEVRTTAELLIVALDGWSLQRNVDERTGFAEVVAARRQLQGS